VPVAHSFFKYNFGALLDTMFSVLFEAKRATHAAGFDDHAADASNLIRVVQKGLLLPIMLMVPE